MVYEATLMRNNSQNAGKDQQLFANIFEAADFVS